MLYKVVSIPIYIERFFFEEQDPPVFNSRDILATVLLTGFYLDGDSASPYPRFPAIFSKNRNDILASQGNFKTVYISCGDEVRDYIFEKNFEKMLYKTFSKFGYIEGSFYPSSAIRFIHF